MSLPLTEQWREQLELHPQIRRVYQVSIIKGSNTRIPSVEFVDIEGRRRCRSLRVLCRELGLDYPDYQVSCRYCGEVFETSDLRTKVCKKSSCQSERQKPRPQYRNYGLTELEFQQLVEACGGKCQICKKKTRLCIDHDHDTGQVRGLLCHRCNSCLGWHEKFQVEAEKYLS